MYETEISYAIYQISEDGLLKRPSIAGYNLFYDYGTMNEAVRAIEEIGLEADYIILTKVSRVWKF